MCGQLTINHECPDCSDVVSISTETLKCIKAKNWGDCGSVHSDNRQASKRADKICSSCQRKKGEEERKKQKERDDAVKAAAQSCTTS
ncbi:hypothetical protein QBC32DRAFT_315551 [Pseudoneurospora amorphoporcata]|uniref:Uncharacterized protein n=1 Tax=Pseudoneurospora amorphoporcata TaxID=241081 RepID=A0AAN6SF06_9PEZI|nr:hypothetical protein QBC32DRAFT_315551 [Pseudoneurospora amorphoporcata]